MLEGCIIITSFRTAGTVTVCPYGPLYCQWSTVYLYTVGGSVSNLSPQVGCVPSSAAGLAAGLPDFLRLPDFAPRSFQFMDVLTVGYPVLKYCALGNFHSLVVQVRTQSGVFLSVRQRHIKNKHYNKKSTQGG